MSKIITRIVWDIETLQVIKRDSIPYSGPWELLKESYQQKQAQQQQQQFSQQMMQTFQTSFGKESATWAILQPQLTAMVTNPQGMGATEYAALQAGIVNTTGAQYANAAKTAQQQFAVGNEAGLPSGVQAQVQGELTGAAAGQVASQSSNLAIANEQLKQQQQQFALSGLGSLAGQQGAAASAAAGQATSGTQAAFNEATQVYNQGSLWKNILGGVVGAGLNFATGGLSGLMQGGSFMSGGGQALGGQSVTG